MEGDRIAQLETDLAKAFQSTPSAWRETHQVLVLFCRQFHFNPLPPHGGRRTAGRLKNALKSFQSTPSAWRETFFSSNNGCYSIHFNPLPPHGGRLQILACNWEIQFISIHSLRMEGDSILPGGWKAMNHFNPLPPHGGRRRLRHNWKPLPLFQSTPSAWRETGNFFYLIHNIVISIHSLRMEGDRDRLTAARRFLYFNPHPPHGGRPELP